MSEIRFFALGGLGENGKNMYVVDIDRQYFILDCGLKYPTAEFFGVDEIIPNYKMLINIKDRIKGIFLTNAHEDHIGALPHLLKELNVPIYATNFTMLIVKDMLKEAKFNLDDLTLNIITQDTTIKAGNVKVSFFNTSHSIPGSVGVAIHTINGSIVYTSDYTFIQGKDKNYQTDFRKINELGERKILMLLVESLGSGMNQDTSINLTLNHKINSVYAAAEGRIIVSLFSSDLQKIQRVIDISLLHKKKIAIIGRKAQRIVDLAIEQGYLNIPKTSLVNLKFLDEKNRNEQKDLVCLITGDRHEPFYMLQRMCNKNDRLIHINKDDTILILTAPVPGTEKMAAKTLDVLYRSDASIQVIDKKLLSISHASAEEIKMMINLLKPEYVIPTIGEYRHQYGVKLLAEELGYLEENVILLDNGDSFNYIQNKTPYVSKSEIKTGEILIDGTAIGDVNDYVMRDREMLAADGVLLVVANVSARQKRIIGQVEIVNKGFVYTKEATEILEVIKELFIEVSTRHLEGKYITWNDYKLDIREAIGKYVYQTTKRKPIIIPVVVATELDKN